MTNDYEKIDGKLFLKSSSVAKAIIGMLDKKDYEELLQQGLGINEKGERI